MSDATPRASRLATPRWLDARLVLGVLLVLLAVVAGARVFAAAGRYSRVYVARHPLVPGERVRADDLSVGLARFSGDGGGYVAATAGPPVGYRVTRYVGLGEFVPITALTSARSGAPDDRLVTVPVVPGHLPADLGHGDVVDVYLTPKASTGAKPAAPTRVLAAAVVDTYDDGSRSIEGGSTVSLVIDVPATDVPTVVRAVESGTLDVVRVPDAVVAAAPVASATP